MRRFGEAFAELAENVYGALVRGRAIATLALQCYDDLARGVSFVEGIAQGYYLLCWGWILHWLGDQQMGVAMTEQALEMAEGRDRALEGQAQYNLAMMSHATGRPHEALRLYEQALVIFREVRDRAREGTTLNNLGSVYNALGQKQQALDYYKQALLIRREVRDRAGEGTTLWNIGASYLERQQYNVALACFLLAKEIYKQVQSPNADAVDRGITNLRERVGEVEFAALLAQVEQQPNEIVERALQEKTLSAEAEQAPSTIPTEQITVIVGNTVAVMTAMPERRAEWRETIAGMLAAAQQRGTNGQIEVEFFTAVLAILDGQSSSLPADHPYAAPIAVIHDGIAKGGPPPGGEDEVPEEVQALAAFVQASVAALRSVNPQEKVAFMQQLAAL